jgi:hypothetical protein
MKSICNLSNRHRFFTCSLSLAICDENVKVYVGRIAKSSENIALVVVGKAS